MPSMAKIASDLYAAQGISGFYRGVSTTVMITSYFPRGFEHHFSDEIFLIHSFFYFFFRLTPTLPVPWS